MCSNESNRWLQKILASATLSLDIHNLFTWNLRCPQLFKSEFTVGKADVSTSPNSMTSGAGHANVKHKSEHAILQTLVLPNSLDHLMVSINCVAENYFKHWMNEDFKKSRTTFR